MLRQSQTAGQRMNREHTSRFCHCGRFFAQRYYHIHGRNKMLQTQRRLQPQGGANRNYGSRGASVNLELELSSELATDPEKLKRPRAADVLAGQSIRRRGSFERPIPVRPTTATQLTGNGSRTGQHPQGPRLARVRAPACHRRSANSSTWPRRYGLATAIDQAESPCPSPRRASDHLDQLKSQSTQTMANGARKDDCEHP